MTSMSPYTYILCPCSDPANLSRHTHNDPTTPLQPAPPPEDYEAAFDPRAPRANFSLYPLEYLLYCVECHQIRCPRCIAEEIVTYYCPSCLFEVPGSNIKSDGNRCTRSCFQCPACVGPLSVTAIDPPPPPPSNELRPDTTSSALPSYILTCSYCQWTSTEIGVKFDKPNGIYAQLQKIRNGGKTRLTPRERKDRRKEPSNSSGTSTVGVGSGLASSALPSIGEEPPARDTAPEPKEHDVETQFANLKSFYQSQLADTSSTATGGLPSSSLGDLGIGSPGSLSRLMSIYTGTGLDAKKQKSRAGLMRESVEPDEGLQIAHLDEQPSLARLHRSEWCDTVSASQTASQPPVNVGEPAMHGQARFLDELRPVPYLLRTKRSKRCPVCRHIVSKPEAKVSNTRFRIRLVAGNFIPSISTKPLQATSLSQTISGAPGQKRASATVQAVTQLAPLRPVQYLLTFKNPIFEPVKVTLATPSVTPGRFASKVTVLCPEFEIDANTDVWDDVLKEGGHDAGSGAKGNTQPSLHEASGQLQAEPGKVWERGRNWVTIVVEVVPASMRLDGHNMSIAARDAKGDLDLSPLREDEDVLEIPMFVRLEWEAEDAAGEGGTSKAKDKGEGRERRELAYWCALGIGRISKDY